MVYQNMIETLACFWRWNKDTKFQIKQNSHSNGHTSAAFPHDENDIQLESSTYTHLPRRQWWILKIQVLYIEWVSRCNLYCILFTSDFFVIWNTDTTVYVNFNSALYFGHPSKKKCKEISVLMNICVCAF